MGARSHRPSVPLLTPLTPPHTVRSSGSTPTQSTHRSRARGSCAVQPHAGGESSTMRKSARRVHAMRAHRLSTPLLMARRQRQGSRRGGTSTHGDAAWRLASPPYASAVTRRGTCCESAYRRRRSRAPNLSSSTTTPPAILRPVSERAASLNLIPPV